jgi:predicted TIM-barrel fold metal-dependent hydrolase
MTSDYSDIPMVDVHCHPWRTRDLLELPQDSFEDRLAMLGMCQITSSSTEDAGGEIARMSDDTPIVLAGRRHLANFLGVEDDRVAVADGRHDRLITGANDYFAELFNQVGLSELFCDDGYPLPAVDTVALGQDIGHPVHRVGRIEPWIKELLVECDSYLELEERFLERVTREANAGAVAFKTVIAYRTGLDVADYTSSEAERAYQGWRADDFRESREHSKPVRDLLLNRLARLCATLDRPLHLHCGGGDPDVRLTYARPTGLFPFISQHPDVPLVLVHGGWPWMEEAAYLSSIFPHVYIDLSLMVPWASLGIDQKLEIVLGTAPGGKVMYGSDEAGEPEVLWLAAKYGRASVARVVDRAIEQDWLTRQQGRRIAEGVLGRNALRLHGLTSS